MDMETIYRLYFRDVYLFLQGLTRSETLAEELTQETFFKALDGLKNFDGKQDVRAWLFTVARNCWYDRCRKAKHTAPLEAAETRAADTPDIAQLLVDKDAAFTVHQCLHALEAVSYTHLRAHETDSYLVCRLLLEKKKKHTDQREVNRSLHTQREIRTRGVA